MRLALGTANFGLHYGIASQEGQVSHEASSQILAIARENSIDTLDTAIAYGDSETCLGELGIVGLSVITKLPALPDGCIDIETWVGAQVKDSLRRLKVESVHGLLLHRSENLQGLAGRTMMKALERLKAEGHVQKIGVSIYDPQELNEVTRACTIDLVQAPLNLIDRRLVNSGWLQRLHDQGVEVHVRSVFLQGLLLMPRTSIPSKFERWAHIWDAWHAGLVRKKLTATSACLQYPLSIPQISKVVVGVDNTAQLRELVAIYNAPATQLNWSALVCEDDQLINPSQWDYM